MICPVVVVLDIKTMEAEVIEKPDSSLGQAIFTADGKGEPSEKSREFRRKNSTGVDEFESDRWSRLRNCLSGLRDFVMDIPEFRSAGVVGVDRPNTPYRLGSIFCNNRLQSIFYYDLSSKTFRTLSAPNKCAFYPRFSPSGKTLIYLENEVGGPHQMAAELLKIDWSSEEKKPTVVVGFPQRPKGKSFVLNVV